MRVAAWPARGLVPLVALIIGCDAAAGSVDPTPGVPTPEAGCRAGEREVSGRCVEAGVQDDGCPAGEHATDDGGCAGAGIPAGACGEGFVARHDACEPVLPRAACPDGWMAVVGETRCRPVAPCASGTWPDVTPGADVHFVDASYAGADSDGSEAKPWRSLQAAVDAAASGATIAVAAGSYAGDVLITGKALTAVGVCPELVEIVGSAAAPAALQIGSSDGKVVVRDVSVTGGAQGIELWDVDEVILERVWIHDTAWRGMYVRGGDPRTPRVVLRDSLVERTRRLGIWVEGAELDVQASVVRDTSADDDGLYGEGIFAEALSGGGSPRARLGVEGSVIERNTKVGIFAAGADVAIDRTVVRDTRPGQGGLGAAVQLQNKPASRARSQATVRRSVLERSVQVGIHVVASDATIEHTLVRDVESDGIATGIGVLPDPDGEASQATIVASVVERSTSCGIQVQGSDATLESTIVRGTRAAKTPEAPTAAAVIAASMPGRVQPATLSAKACLLADNEDVGLFVASSEAHVDGTLVRGGYTDADQGTGVAVQRDPDTGADAALTLSRSVVEDNQVNGVQVHGGQIEIVGSVVRSSRPSSLGTLGRGVTVQEDALLGVRGRGQITASVIADNHEGGVVITGSDVGLDGVVIRDTIGDHERGVGLVLQSSSLPPPADATIALVRGVLIERSREAGILIFDSHVEIDSTTITDAAATSDSFFGDGIAVVRALGTASLALRGSHIARSERAAIASFGALVHLGETQIDCNSIDLDGEVFLDRPFEFLNLGGNRCGCGEAEEACEVMSSSLEAPGPLASKR